MQNSVLQVCIYSPVMYSQESAHPFHLLHMLLR